jgi:hypothetical protein
VKSRDAAATIAALAAEVDRRATAGDDTAEPILLVIYDLARFRDLKKSDDFSFSDDGPPTGKQFAAVLRDGPAVGVHAIVWCDAYNNLQRWLDRQALRDLEMRVLFQMSVTDSSNLMDSPAASRLGPHLAYYYSEELGEAEKFRPYALPSTDWLAEIHRAAASPTDGRVAGAGQSEAEEAPDAPRVRLNS